MRGGGGRKSGTGSRIGASQSVGEYKPLALCNVRIIIMNKREITKYSPNTCVCGGFVS